VPTSTTQAGRRDAMSVTSHNLSLSAPVKQEPRCDGVGKERQLAQRACSMKRRVEPSHPSISDHHCTA
jgi:hypothetical protein